MSPLPRYLVLATRNAHKVGEIQAILGPAFECVDLNRFPGVPAVVEDAPTFAGNATKKAVELARWLAGSSLLPERRATWVLADDSGLEVDALNGAPGVHSARFAALDAAGAPAGNSKDADNNAKLLRLLANAPAERRTARFRCVLALAPVAEPVARGASPACDADEIELGVRIFDGACEGRIALEPRGRGGFGYDPLFVPDGWDKTFGELGESVKNGLSHRARALAKLKDWLNG